MSVRVAALVVAALAPLALTSTAAAAPTAAVDGEFAFVRIGADAAPDVWTTGPPSRVLSVTGQGLDPAYRPDGQRIAFSDGRDLFTMRFDGRNTVQLTDDPAADRHPVYTVDGRGVLFDRVEPTGASNIYFLRLTGLGLPTGAPVRLTGSSAATLRNERPTVSPDGTRFAFQSNRRGAFDIYSLRLAREGASNPVDLLTGSSAGDDLDAAWSPDGRTILYARVNELWRMDSDDGGGQRILTLLPDVAEREPAWSPDGSQIAFRRFSAADGNDEIFVIRAEPENRRNPAVNVTNDPAADADPDWRPVD